MQEFWESVEKIIGPFMPLIEIIIIILAAIVLSWVVKRVIRHTVEGIVSGVKKRRGVQETALLALRSPLESVRTVQRARTIGQVLTNIAKVIIWTVAVFMCIGAINPNFLASLTILSAAIGAGLGFGAQRIVGDVLNGLFMVLEDQIGVGDWVDLQYASGVVEAVGVRVTQVRDVYGDLWYVRNGEIQRVGNSSQGWNRAIIDLAVPYDVDVQNAQAIMLEAAQTMHDDIEWLDKFVGEPEIWGLESLSAEAVIVRLAAKVRPGERWEVQRELRRRIQEAFKNESIHLPPMNTVVFNGPNGMNITKGSGVAERQQKQRRVTEGEDPTTLDDHA